MANSDSSTSISSVMRKTSRNDFLDDEEPEVEEHFESLLDDTTSEEEDSETTTTRPNFPTAPQPKAHKSIADSEIDVDEIVLSLMWQQGHLGAAYYNMTTSELFVMDDTTEDTFNYNITKTIFIQSQPSYVITTYNSPIEFQNILKKLIVKDSYDDQMELSESSDVDGRSPISLQILNKRQNSFEFCYHRVQCLKLDSEPEELSNADRITFLNSVLNFNSKLMIHALGLLLKYLDENWSKLTLSNNTQIQFLYVNYIMLNDLVMIDEDTFQILNIMQHKYHPSLFKFGVSVVEEGMSLFTFLNRCQSRPGAKQLWNMMRHPTRDLKVLEQRHRVIKFFMDPGNLAIYQNLRSNLKQISRLTPNVLKRYKTPQAKPSDWAKLSKTISHLIIIGEICESCKNFAHIFEKVATSITEGIHRVRYFVDYIIDPELSKQQGQFVVRAGVDPELDELNQRRESLPQILTDAAEKEMPKLPENVDTFRMIYLSDIGYLLAITGWNGACPEDVEIPGLEFKFSANGARHYKSEGARELDDLHGDIVMGITTRQKQVMLRLIDYVSKHITSIVKSITCCAELDALLSLYAVSRDQDYIQPKMMMAHIIEIEGGKHPLKELFGTYVPNDTHSGGNGSLIKIFSGPNSCGKSLYMKQVALIVYMAHIGCFVPAKKAKIGVVTHILTQMSSTQTMSQNVSSYLVDLRQQSNLIYASTPNSLLLMDEFGRGTTEVVGLALLTSILLSFIERGDKCPHILCATHIHRVKELLPETPLVETQTFEFALDDDKGVVFLYKLISGNVKLSFAHAVARKSGLADDIVDRAEKVYEFMKKGKLPRCDPEEDRRNVIQHLAELSLQKNVPVDEVKQWLKQVFIRKLPNKNN